MAHDHNMIEPFEEKQVHEGVISYGVSSYGYDMRVADEFKVFTNVFNVIVDPKNFNPRSFVDIKAEYCDIPPNSFALARSVERFSIPRDVLCVVMGKSSYARCFRGDTRVALVDGTSLSLEEMAHRSTQGEQFQGYSVDREGCVIVSLLQQPRYIGRDPLVQVIIDNGEAIYCTPDHKFLLRNGTMLAAEHLTPGTSLMPLYQEMIGGNVGVQAVQSLNHRVVGVHLVQGEHDVYCLSVPEAGNFALEAGVFVSNCGIIVNVTPLEPEWQGYITIEVSNTTPLPARIYANEGIGQILFFESDSPCEVSYADRKGKYQSQQGIVLPHLGQTRQE